MQWVANFKICSSFSNPDLVSSEEVLISNRIFCTLPSFSDWLLISSAKESASTECISVAALTTYFTLFFCKVPIKCQLTLSPISWYLSRNSCALFSPKSVIPKLFASLIAFKPKYRITSYNVCYTKLLRYNIILTN